MHPTRTVRLYRGQPQSHLLALPRELRDPIYHHIFTDSVIRIDATKTRSRKASVLLACKQIFNEAISLYYAGSILFIDGSHFDAWITQVPWRHYQQLREVWWVADDMNDEITMTFAHVRHEYIEGLGELFQQNGFELGVEALKVWTWRSDFKVAWVWLDERGKKRYLSIEESGMDPYA